MFIKTQSKNKYTEKGLYVCNSYPGPDNFAGTKALLSRVFPKCLDAFHPPTLSIFSASVADATIISTNIKITMYICYAVVVVSLP